MSVDGRFIKYLSIELDQVLATGKIQKISQISNTDFIFLIRAKGQNNYLYMSLSTSAARVHLIKKPDDKFDMPGGFCMFLRKHIEGGFINSIQSINHDRIIQLSITNVNDLGDKETFKIIIELFGRYANMIILDNNQKILNAYKHINPFDNRDRIIINGIKYLVPQDDKINPENLVQVEEFFKKDDINFRDIIENIRGISPLLAQTLIKNANHQSSYMFEAYTKLMSFPLKPTLAKNKKIQFYFIDIFQENQVYYDSLSDLLEYFYQAQTDKEKVKQVHKYLQHFSKNQLRKYKNKLEKLTKDLNTAKANDIYRMKADLLIQDQHKINSSDLEYTGFSYELNKDLKVVLDRKISIIQNANKYYKKYKKYKTAIQHLSKQIILTKHEVNYFISLTQQIENTFNLRDLEEIKAELIDLKYLPKRKGKKQSKESKLNYESYSDELGISILVGKNNMQNNFLTHKFARKNDLWFHVQNQSGSHVIVQSEDIQESTLRHAANLAAYYSKSQHSSSVAVDYTLVKNIKKIPGELGSLVSYTHQKTIYIDPDETMISQLKKHK